MISINCGCNFDPKLPTILNVLNEKVGKEKGIRIGEVYGSVPGIGLGSVRTKSRLQILTLDRTEKILQSFRNRGIEFNYTINKSVIGTLKDLKENLHSIEMDYFEELVSKALISRVTIAHPLIMEEFSKRFKIPIEISTITEVATPLQMKKLKERVPTIDKICMHLHLNRNFPLLSQFVEEGTKLGIKIELLLNEFCTFQCPDRNFCYDLQSCQTHREKDFDLYPHGRCIADRNDPVEWLKTRFILPQWMEKYSSSVGIHHFKLTGRTHPTSYIQKMASIYLQGYWGGNLLELWAHLENIERKGELVGPKFYIPASQIKFDKIFDIGNKMSGFYCDLSCSWCEVCQTLLNQIDYKILR